MPADGLIHNERIKWLVGALNNVGLVLVIGGAVAPALSGQFSLRSGLIGLVWSIAGASFHGGAQFLLGKLTS